MEEQPQRISASELYDYEYRYQNALKLLEQSDKMSPADKQLIKNFLHHLEALGRSKGRIAKYGQILRKIAENLGVEINKATRPDIEKLLLWIFAQKWKPKYEVDFVDALKRFYKYVRYGNVDRETPYPEDNSKGGRIDD